MSPSAATSRPKLAALPGVKARREGSDPVRLAISTDPLER
jgi:hypothetical protein